MQGKGMRKNYFDGGGNQWPFSSSMSLHFSSPCVDSIFERAKKWKLKRQEVHFARDKKHDHTNEFSLSDGVVATPFAIFCAVR
jgi:hypothetical protein